MVDVGVEDEDPLPPPPPPGSPPCRPAPPAPPPPPRAGGGPDRSNRAGPSARGRPPRRRTRGFDGWREWGEAPRPARGATPGSARGGGARRAARHIEAANELAGVLRSRGLRIEVDESSNRMQNKIRLAQGQKVPYMLILGDREVEGRTASVRRRDGSQEQGVAWADLAARLGEELRARRLE